MFFSVLVSRVLTSTWADFCCSPVFGPLKQTLKLILLTKLVSLLTNWVSTRELRTLIFLDNLPSSYLPIISLLHFLRTCPLNFVLFGRLFWYRCMRYLLRLGPVIFSTKVSARRISWRVTFETFRLTFFCNLLDSFYVFGLRHEKLYTRFSIYWEKFDWFFLTSTTLQFVTRLGLRGVS